MVMVAFLWGSTMMASGMQHKQMMLQGAHIFAKCSTCHGSHAEKHALGVSEVIAQFSKGQIVRALKGYRAAVEHDRDAMIMNAQAKHLSNAQIHAVATYIKSLN